MGSIDWSFIESVAPKQAEPVEEKQSGFANVTVRVDADCMMLCDGEYVDIPLKEGVMSKVSLPVGQHLLEFMSAENPNVKVEKVVDWPESDKNYLVIVNELKARIAPPMVQKQVTTPPTNPFLDQLNMMQGYNPLMAAQQMQQQFLAQKEMQNAPTVPPPFPPEKQ